MRRTFYLSLCCTFSGRRTLLILNTDSIRMFFSYAKHIRQGLKIINEVLLDVNQRLDRWLKMKQAAPLENSGFQYGVNSTYFRQVVKHWRNNYSWKDRQTLLNKYQHYKTNINGLDMHFIRVSPHKKDNKRVLPLLMLHGWPGSVKEFYSTIPLLTSPREEYDFVFDLVIPSLPGYGFSEGSSKVGLGPAQIAVVMNNLMKRIGFEEYYVQGGDWGSVIGRMVSILYPNRVLGLHTNMCPITTPTLSLKRLIGTVFPSLVVEAKHQHLMFPLSDVIFNFIQETGYFHIQATKPDTIGTVLHDTPVGLAAYILEKFSSWTNLDYRNLEDGGLTKRFSMDDLLDNVMIYWVTGSITTSQRLYAEAYASSNRALRMGELPVRVPSAMARYHHDALWIPESSLREVFLDLVHVSDMEDGGHFAAFELPKVFSDDLWAAFKKISDRNLEKNKN